MAPKRKAWSLEQKAYAIDLRVREQKPLASVVLAFKIKYDATVSVQTVSDWCKPEHQAKVRAQLESGAQADSKR